MARTVKILEARLAGAKLYHSEEVFVNSYKTESVYRWPTGSATVRHSLSIEHDILTPAGAVATFALGFDTGVENLEEVRRPYGRTGYLPVAIIQAAACTRSGGIRIDEYVDDLDGVKSKSFQTNFPPGVDLGVVIKP